MVDVADPRSVEQMVEFAVETFGGLHLAVNNAGIGGPSETTANYPLEDWQKIIDVNLNGVFYGLRYEIAAMLKSGGGAIVNMSSILGSVGWGNACAYVSTKHALVGLTKTAAMSTPARIFASTLSGRPSSIRLSSRRTWTLKRSDSLPPCIQLAGWEHQRKSRH